MPRASFEVPGSCADQRLTFSDNALAAPPADAAVGVHDDGAGFHKGLKDPFLQRLAVDGLACRDYQEAYQRMDLFPSDDRSSHPQVFDPAVVAGAQ